MKKMNTNTAKVNKEIGGWDYKGYHIDRNKALKCLVIVINGDEVVAKTLGEAKVIIDEVIENEAKAGSTDAISFTSKRGTQYLVQVVNGIIKAFTYEDGKKTYWTVTNEIRNFIATL